MFVGDIYLQHPSPLSLPPPPPKNAPAGKFASQSDAPVKTDAKIKFLYYPLYEQCVNSATGRP